MKTLLAFACVALAALATVFVWHSVWPHASQGASASVSDSHAFQQQQVESPSSRQAIASPSTANEPAETERRLGPFSISGNSYTVVLHLNPRRPGSTQETGDTVVAMEIQDTSGTVRYQRRFPYQERDATLSDAWYASAIPLVGTNGSGLLVRYSFDSEPSAPEEDSPVWWQIFGVVAGKLKPFSAPLYADEPIGWDDSRKSSVYKSVGPLGSAADEIQFPVWTGHFRLIYPVRVEWTDGTLSPVQPCPASTPARDLAPSTDQSGTGSQSLSVAAVAIQNSACEYKVLPDNDRQVSDTTFVTLCGTPAPNCSNAERVVVRSNSEVVLLLARVNAQWVPGLASGPSDSIKSPADAMNDSGGVGLDRSSDIWLKVRIDGKEGWIHGEEDFAAFGFPQDE
jgi:hypothetical protein